MNDTGRVRRPAVWLLLALLPTVLAGCTGRAGVNTDSGTSPQLKTVGGVASGVFPAGDRQLAPPLSGRTIDDQPLDVSQYLGKVVVLNFWASWCAPCRAEASSLNAAYAQTRSLGVVFVGIDFKDDRVSARAFDRNKQVPYPSLFDTDGSLLLEFRGTAPQAPPSTFILDRKGRVAARFLQAVTTTELLGPLQAISAEPT